LRKPPHGVALRLAFMAALALLIAQFGAVSHSYAHDIAAGAPTAQRSALANHDPCTDCLAFAPLLAAAGASGSLLSIEPPGRGLAARPTAGSPLESSLSLAFRSRAPPAVAWN
jgi:hypothetical protein